jgi:hypothetical protein
MDGLSYVLYRTKAREGAILLSGLPFSNSCFKVNELFDLWVKSYKSTAHDFAFTAQKSFDSHGTLE